MKPTSSDGKRLYEYIEKRFDELEKKLEELKQEETKRTVARKKSTEK